MHPIFHRQSGFVRWLGTTIVLAIAGVAGWTWITLNFSYSTGERAGVVSKLSHKGWVCKTWEGELLISAMPGMVAEKFHFSVRDDKTAARINAAVLQRQQVALVYAQHKGIPSNCFGETEYFVIDIKQLRD